MLRSLGLSWGQWLCCTSSQCRRILRLHQTVRSYLSTYRPTDQPLINIPILPPLFYLFHHHLSTDLPTYRLVLDGPLRTRLAAKARPSILTLEHTRVMDMMVSNYETVIQNHNSSSNGSSTTGQGGTGRRRTEDLYITFVYYFFSMILFVLTPTLKAYVAVVKFLHQVSTCSFTCNPTIATCSINAFSTGVQGLCTSLTYKEKLRVLVGCVYVLATLVICRTLYNSPASA